MRTLIPAALFTIFLAGCGGGGGDAGGSAVGPSTPSALGSAVLPGATIVVTKTSGTVAAGATISIRVTSADPGIATIEVLVGASWEGATATTVVAADRGIWDASVTLPSPLPAGSSILVRLTFSNGNVVESSQEAFTL